MDSHPLSPRRLLLSVARAFGFLQEEQNGHHPPDQRNPYDDALECSGDLLASSTASEINAVDAEPVPVLLAAHPRRRLPASFAPQGRPTVPSEPSLPHRTFDRWVADGTGEAKLGIGIAIASASLPSLQFPGTVIYAASEAECVAACAALEASLARASDQGNVASGSGASSTMVSSRRIRALGFDTEWLVTFERGAPQRPVATLQLASADVATVFHLTRVGRLPPCVADLLKRPDIIKVGIGAHGDARRLELDWGERCASVAESADALAEAVNPVVLASSLQVRGVLDLKEIALRVLKQGEALPRSMSLAALCEQWLGHHLEKPPDVRMGNWEAVPLSEAQLIYAATDAWAGVQLLSAMSARGIDSVDQLLAAVAEGRPASIPAIVKVCKRPLVADIVACKVAADLKPLSPAKREVYRLFAENSLTIESIAALRGVQVSTVMGYLTDAIVAGYAYSIADFGISVEHLNVVSAALQVAGVDKDGTVPGRLKVVKDTLPVHISYSTIRLVAAHLARQASAGSADVAMGGNLSREEAVSIAATAAFGIEGIAGQATASDGAVADADTRHLDCLDLLSRPAGL